MKPNSENIPAPDLPASSENKSTSSKRRPVRWAVNLVRRIRWWKAGLAVAVVAAATWWLIPRFTPLPARLTEPVPVSTTYLSSDGKPLRQLLSAEGQRVAAPVSYEEIPPALIHATLAAEDKRFFDHGGVDLLATTRAAW